MFTSFPMIFAPNKYSIESILSREEPFLLAPPAVTEWLSSWLAEQENRGSIPGLATRIFRDWLSPASKSRYGWNTAEAT